MKIDNYKKEAELLRDTDTYKVYDLKSLVNITLSLTELHPNHNTSGHLHEDADEIYVFISGKGQIEIGKTGLQDCEGGDVFLIPRGSFHKVYNTDDCDLKFWSIFEKYGKRK